MPKVNYVKARKDYPEASVKKGDMYYTWSLLLGPRSSRTYRQLTPPKRSQLTTSTFLQGIYDIEDRIASLTSLDDVEDIVQALRDLASEEEEKYDNLPEGLQQSDTGRRIESRKDGCNTAADEIEAAVEEFDEDEPEEEGEEKQAWLERKEDHNAEIIASIQAVDISYD